MKMCEHCDQPIADDQPFFVLDGKCRHPICNTRDNTYAAKRVVFHDPAKKVARVVKTRTGGFEIKEQDLLDAGLVA